MKSLETLEQRRAGAESPVATAIVQTIQAMAPISA